MEKLIKLVTTCLTMAMAATALVACGKPYPVTIDQAFEPYLETIQREVSARGGPDYFTRISSVKMVDRLPNDLDGYCNWNTDKNGYTERIIRVSRVFWNSASDLEKIALLTHELGHCVLHRDHDNSEFFLNEERLPKSFMYSDPSRCGRAMEFSDDENSSLRKHYFDEFLGL